MGPASCADRAAIRPVAVDMNALPKKRWVQLELPFDKAREWCYECNPNVSFDPLRSMCEHHYRQLCNDLDGEAFARSVKETLEENRFDIYSNGVRKSVL